MIDFKSYFAPGGAGYAGPNANLSSGAYAPGGSNYFSPQQLQEQQQRLAAAGQAGYKTVGTGYLYGVGNQTLGQQAGSYYNGGNQPKPYGSGWAGYNPYNVPKGDPNDPRFLATLNQTMSMPTREGPAPGSDPYGSGYTGYGGSSLTASGNPVYGGGTAGSQGGGGGSTSTGPAGYNQNTGTVPYYYSGPSGPSMPWVNKTYSTPNQNLINQTSVLSNLNNSSKIIAPFRG